MKPEKRTGTSSNAPLPLVTKIRLTVFVIFVLVDNASVIALAPCVSSIQRDILASTTDCAKEGMCDGYLAKYNGMSGAIRSLGGVLLSAPYGVLADKYGRKPLMVASCLIPLLTLPLLLRGIPGGVKPFYVVNALVGLLPRGGSVEAIMIIDLTSPSNRLKVFSYFQMGMMLLGLVATTVSTAVVGVVGEQGILLCSCVITFIEFFVFVFVLPETATFKEPDEEQQEDCQASSKQQQEEQRPEQLRRQTSQNISDVLFKSKDLDEDHKWEFKAFWLYLLCMIPESMTGAVLPFMLHDFYNVSTAMYGVLISLSMVYGFFWLSLGLVVLQSIFSDEARILQAAVAISFVSDLWLIFGVAHWTPLVAAFGAGATALVPLTLKTVILNVTAEHRQGKIMGFLTACDALIGVVAPPLGGGIFSFGHSIGFPRVPWFLLISTLKPLVFVLASYIFLMEAMPPDLQARQRQKSRTKTVANEKGEPLMGI